MHRDLNGRPWMFQRSKVIFLACSCKCKWCELEVTVALVAGIYTCSTQAVPYNTLLVWWNTSYLYMLEVGVGSNTPLLTVSTLNYRPLPRFLSFTVQSCACCPLSPMMLYTSSYFDASQLTTNTGRHCWFFAIHNQLCCAVFLVRDLGVEVCLRPDHLGHQRHQRREEWEQWCLWVGHQTVSQPGKTRERKIVSVLACL